jgi:hypothetical protein
MAGARDAFPAADGVGAMMPRLADRFRFPAARGRMLMVVMRFGCSRCGQDQRRKNKKQQKNAFGHSCLWSKNIIA